jgi:Oxidoreductase-like protein, N-terminal
MPPREPAPEECCGKGCTPCVFDVYGEALERYRAELKKFLEEDARAKAKPRRRT